MSLAPGVTISANRVVAAISAGQGVTNINNGVGMATVNPAINTYNSGAAQTETVPALATRVRIEIVGPSGSGGTGNLASPGGGGGGGGAYVAVVTACTPGQTFTYTVGTVSGTASTVVNGTAPFISLSAGSGTDGASSAAGGAAGLGGVASNSYGGVATNGSNGTAGLAGIGGAGGSGAPLLGGAGGPSPGTGSGISGTAPGGGGSGSGSASAAAGGPTTAGRIIFTYFVDKLAIDTNAVAGSNFDDGFVTNAVGALYGTTTVAGTDVYEAGLRRSTAGALVYVVGAPTQYSNGNPIDNNGALACI